MGFLIFFFIPHHGPRNTQENHYLAEFYKEKGENVVWNMQYWRPIITMVQPMASLYPLTQQEDSLLIFLLNGKQWSLRKLSFHPSTGTWDDLGELSIRTKGYDPSRVVVFIRECWGLRLFAHSTVKSTIWSRLKSSDSKSNLCSNSYFSSSSCSLVSPSLSSLQTIGPRHLVVVFPGEKHSLPWSYCRKLSALTRSYNLWLHLLLLGRVILKWLGSELSDLARVVFPKQWNPRGRWTWNHLEGGE